jgi:mRNA deadenylase 3'-5' endonuclease subunit Ccr4
MYKWDNPQHWLNDKAGEWDREKLYNALIHLTQRVDLEEIQSYYQDEMDQDGYFEEE